MKEFLKGFLYLSLLVLPVFTVSCDDEEETTTPTVVPVEDGLYVTGAATGLPSVDVKGLMTIARNEVLQADRAGLYEFYVAVKAGEEGFSIVQVSGSTQKTFGPGEGFAEVALADRSGDEPKSGSLKKGAIVETTTKFTVEKDGLYHVIFDVNLGKGAVVEVAWGVIGGATPNGWDASTPMTSSAFDLNKMTFEIPEIVLKVNEWKFRYSDGWKIVLDTEVALGGGKKGVNVNSNFGNEGAKGQPLGTLLAGGENFANDKYGVYKVVLTWELGKLTAATSTFVKDAEPLPTYPATMNMIGASIGGWDWAANGIAMIPVHSNPHLFWQIVYITKGADGFKFAPEMKWADDFGVVAADGATAGVWKKGADNVPDVHETGYYMVVVNLKNNTVEVSAPLVYGIGDAFGSWDPIAANLFTVDNTNKVIVSPAAVADKDLRISVGAATLTKEDNSGAVSWWQAELSIIDGDIVYRGAGGELAAVAITTGQKASLNFSEGTGSIQ